MGSRDGRDGRDGREGKLQSRPTAYRLRPASQPTAYRLPPALPRILSIAALLGALWFAVFAGEYSTVDLFRQRTRRARLAREADSLAGIVDSLQRLRRAIQTDPVVQERIAREEFGMVKGSRELLYRFAEPDGGNMRDSARPSP